MILEEIDGDVKVILKGQPLTLGSPVEDKDFSLVTVTGKGKVIFRVDPSTTVEAKGVEAESAATPTPAPVEIKLTAESTVKAVEAPVKVTNKEPAAE